MIELTKLGRLALGHRSPSNLCSSLHPSLFLRLATASVCGVGFGCRRDFGCDMGRVAHENPLREILFLPSSRAFFCRNPHLGKYVATAEAHTQTACDQHRNTGAHAPVGPVSIVPSSLDLRDAFSVWPFVRFAESSLFSRSGFPDFGGGVSCL